MLVVVVVVVAAVMVAKAKDLSMKSRRLLLLLVEDSGIIESACTDAPAKASIMRRTTTCNIIVGERLVNIIVDAMVCN